METTTIFLALLALLFVGLTYRVSQQRGRVGVAVGNGDDVALTRAIRAHGNFAEFTPILIFIMWMIEYNIGNEWQVWVFGIIILTGRVLHAYGMLAPSFPMWARFVGMICTLLPLVVGALWLLYLALT